MEPVVEKKWWLCDEETKKHLHKVMEYFLELISKDMEEKKNDQTPSSNEIEN